MARPKYIIWIFNESQEKEYLERKKPKYAIVKAYDGNML